MYKIEKSGKPLRFAFLFILFPFILSAQEDQNTRSVNNGIGVVPQYSIMNGMRVDIDLKLPKPGQWLIIGPQFYINTGNSNLWNYEELNGFGIDLNHRIFMKPGPLPKGAYLAYGPVFQYFSVKDNGLTSYVFEEFGTEYVGLRDDLIHTRIYKFGGNLMLGYQALISEVFYIDTYIGTGIRFSYDNRIKGLHGYYNDGWLDLGYSGTLIVGGIRFGVVF